MHLCMHTCAHRNAPPTCTHSCVHIPVHIYKHVHTNVHTHTHMCVHTHTHLSQDWQEAVCHQDGCIVNATNIALVFETSLLAIISPRIIFCSFWHQSHVSINSTSNGVCDFIALSYYNRGGKFNKHRS